jgi:hypothetical protein
MVIGLHKEGRGANALMVHLRLKLHLMVGLRDEERMRSRPICIWS